MAAKRKPAPLNRTDQDKLLERIARRYEQFDEELKELEAKVPELDDGEAQESMAPRKPR